MCIPLFVPMSFDQLINNNIYNFKQLNIIIYLKRLSLYQQHTNLVIYLDHIVVFFKNI